jgi:hypothetical protein
VVVQTLFEHACPDEQILLHDAQFDIVPKGVSQPLTLFESQLA